MSTSSQEVDFSSPENSDSEVSLCSSASGTYQYGSSDRWSPLPVPETSQLELETFGIAPAGSTSGIAPAGSTSGREETSQPLISSDMTEREPGNVPSTDRFPNVESPTPNLRRRVFRPSLFQCEKRFQSPLEQREWKWVRARLEKERREKYKNPVMRVWSALLSIVSIYTAIELPLVCGFQLSRTTLHIVVHYTIDILFFFDILLFYYRSKSCKDSESKKSYSKAELVCTIIGTVPVEIAGNYTVSQSHSVFQSHSFSYEDHISNLLQLNRLLRVMSILTRALAREVDIVTNSLRLFRFLLGILLSMHWIGCLWHWLGVVEAANDDRSWLLDFGILDADITTRYISSVYWVLQTVVKLGYGDIKPLAETEMLFFLCLNLFGAVFYAFMVGSITLVLAQTESQNDQYRRKLVEVKQFFKTHGGVSEDLSRRVFKFYDYVWTKYKTFGSEDIVSELPVALHSSVLHFVHSKMFSESPLYSNLHPALLKSLSEHLTFAAVIKGESVVLEGFIGFRLFFIRHGQIGIWSRERGFLTLLRDGCSFGEIAILKKIPRTATATALTNAELYYITTKQLQKLFLAFPGFKEILWEIAEVRDKQTGLHDDAIITGPLSSK